MKKSLLLATAALFALAVSAPVFAQTDTTGSSTTQHKHKHHKKSQGSDSSQSSTGSSR